MQHLVLMWYYYMCDIIIYDFLKLLLLSSYRAIIWHSTVMFNERKMKNPNKNKVGCCLNMFHNITLNFVQLYPDLKH